MNVSSPDMFFENKDVEATENAKAAEGETAENAAVTKDADADENAEAAENSAAQTETTTRTRVYTKVTKEAEPTTKVRYIYNDEDGRLTVTGIEANDADRGETATFVNKYTPPKTPDKPDKPDKPSKPSKPSRPSNPSNPQRRNPPTGDSSNVMLWLILLAGAAAAVGTLIYVRRKNREEDEKAA